MLETQPILRVKGLVGTMWEPLLQLHERTATGPLTDPDEIAVTLRKPNPEAEGGIEEEEVTAERVLEGEYQVKVLIDAPGRWELLPKATNPDAPGKLIFEAEAP
jgi:hypothetical protein